MLNEPLLSEYLSRKETASQFRVDARTVDRWRRIGDNGLPYVKIGGRIYFHRGDVTAWLNKQRKRNTPKER